MSLVSSEYQKEHNARLTKLQKESTLHHLNQERQFSELRGLLVSLSDQVSSLRSIDTRSKSEGSEVKRSLDKLDCPRPAVLKVFSQTNIATIEKQMRDLAMDTNLQEKRQAIIGSLNFAARPDRYGAITEAHDKTFRWAFDTRYGLLAWLTSGSGIFWVSGRPGSGKSTFMKWLIGQGQTREALNRWSSSGDAIISSHYFWIFGRPMQKSWEGFLRTVLFEIFQQCPELVPFGCNDRWTSELPHTWSGPWSLSELRKTLHAVTHSARLTAKICFFIDGLDEYDGDHLEVIEDITALTESPNVKACVSSRSWNVFCDAFAHNSLQVIYIHELTRGDIYRYVRDRLSSHPRWPHLTSRTGSADHLIQDVTDRSYGVFLWVILVTKQLRGGLTNDDTLADMSRRLAGFPTDLENFFDHMIQSVESIYHEKMASTLLIAKTATKPLHVLYYELHDREHDDQHYYIQMTPCLLEDYQIFAIEERVRRRINAYSKGLLEVHNQEVEFLHRTVADFLNLRHILLKLQEKCPPWFRPELSHARAELGVIKGSDLSGPHCHGTLPAALRSRVDFVMTLSATFDEEPSKFRDEFHLLLDEVEWAISRRPQEDSGDYSGNKENQSFRQMILRSGNPDYIDKALQKDSTYFDILDIPPLYVLFLDGTPTKYVGSFIVLLRHGADPNQEHVERGSISTTYRPTPWTKLVSLSMLQNTNIAAPSRILSPFSSICHSGLMGLLLRHGADPNAVICRPEAESHSLVWVDTLFACFEVNVRDEAVYLDILEQIAQRGVSTGKLMSSTIVLRRFFGLLYSRSWFSVFATQVLEKVIQMAYNSRWNMDPIWPEIRKTLGPQQLQRLRQIYHNLGQEMDMEDLVIINQKTGTKRPCSLTEDNEDGRKRQALS
ncbi:hypothetical protein PG989_010682 [Apiospora arundinis]